jgi:WD40 repeat protein
MKRRLILISLLSGILINAAGQFGFNVKKNFGETSHQIYFASFTPDGNYIITCGSDNNVIIWNAEKGTIYKTLTGLKHRQNCAIFTPDKSILVSAGEDNIITIWDPETGSIKGDLKGHTGPVKTIDISPDGKLLASGGTDKSVFIWDLRQNSLLYELKGHRKDVNVVRFSPDGSILASGGGDNNVILWNTSTWSIIKSKPVHDGWVRDLDFSPDGSVIASCGYDKMIYTSSVPDLNLINSLKGHKEWVQTVDFSPDGKYLLSGGHDQLIILWDAATGKMLSQSARQGQIVLAAEFSPLHTDFISASLFSEKLDTWVLSGIDETQWITSVNKPAEIQMPAESKVIPEEERIRSNSMIEIFSPVASGGRIIHDRSSILIIGRVSDPEGINTFLIDKNLIKPSEGGIFQFTHNLTRGENIISLIAINNKGIMNEQKLIVDCTSDDATGPGEVIPEIAKGKYYALLIGINEYQSNEITDLDNPVKDAESLYNVLMSKYTFEKDNVIFLKNPTRGEIIMALDKFKQKLSANDNLLIFYAGHGYWDEKGKVGYWFPSEILFSSFKQAVMNNSPNVPQYGVIQNVGDEGGDFIFIHK